MSRYTEAINLLWELKAAHEGGRIIAEYPEGSESLDKIDAVLAIPENEAERLARECDELAALVEK